MPNFLLGAYLKSSEGLNLRIRLELMLKYRSPSLLIKLPTFLTKEKKQKKIIHYDNSYVLYNYIIAILKA